MVLSNAERQKRFRERRAAIARGEKLPQQVREAVLAALAVLYDLYRRNGISTGIDADAKDFDEFKSFVVPDKPPPRGKPLLPGSGAIQLLQFLDDDFDDITDAERDTILRARSIIAAAVLLD